MSTGTTGVTDTPVSKPMARKPLCIFSAMSSRRARRCGSASMISSALSADAMEAGVMDAEKMTERALWRDVVDDVRGPGEHAAQRREALGERPHHQVRLRLQPEVLGGAPAVLAQHAHGVRVIRHHPRVVLLRQLHDARQVADVALHGEHAVGDDDLPRVGLLLRRLLQQLLEVLHVVVAVTCARWRRTAGRRPPARRGSAGPRRRCRGGRGWRTAPGSSGSRWR